MLEAYSGRETEHTRIPVGTWVFADRRRHRPGSERAGRARGRKLPGVQRVDPVGAGGADPAGGTILGQIDIDSDVPDPFTPEEEAAVKQVADALAVLL